MRSGLGRPAQRPSDPPAPRRGLPVTQSDRLQTTASMSVVVKDRDGVCGDTTRPAWGRGCVSLNV